ncbi:adenosine-specific kinase [Candidatus Micrarchaeota archaeon]|nr:adenosine-specific kinase [Candidatus Micrarchaeota archaeon]
MVKLESVEINIPEGCNAVLGQSHFIKTVEDLYETIIESGPGIKFGLAFCEASGKRLIRSDGNDEKLIEKAVEEIKKISAGHTFLIFLKEGYPINVLNRIKNVSEVAKINCATANFLEVIVAETQLGRGVLGVIDGQIPLGIETEKDKDERKEFLRKIGYKR